MDFKEFKALHQAQFQSMVDGVEFIFATDVDKDELWDTYLNSFPEEVNQIYRERQAFDCSCCRNFIRAFGNVVAIKDNKLVSVWDFDPGDNEYKPVVNALSDLVRSRPVRDAFITNDGAFGTDQNHEQLENGDVHTWHHFRINLPRRLVSTSSTPARVIAQHRDTKNVFRRSLEELSRQSIETALELIAEKVLYRGEQWQTMLTKFLECYDAYHSLPDDQKDNFCWSTSMTLGPTIGRIRNYSIGVLLQDLTNGTDLDIALRRYETVVAPTNYKRPKAVFTKKMVEEAEKVVTELGLVNSLGRRHAVLADITINNVIWANRDAVKHMAGVGGVFAALKDEVSINPQNYKDIPSVGIEKFLSDVLPSAKSIQVLFENRHIPNLVSLIAPQDSESPTLFSWDNPFSWAYNGNVTDSMKQRVKAAGGNVEGVLRFSIQWNDGEDNQNDYDAHCKEPNGNHIWFGNARYHHPSSGMLDVDIIHPGRKVAVENITWTNRSRMQDGIYELYVHNYSHRGGRTGFDAEIEYDGQVYEFAYHKDLPQSKAVGVATVEFSKRGGIRFIESLPRSSPSRTKWGLATNKFHPVSAFMFSPNYWDDQHGHGNRHFMFMLADCVNNTRPNGFFNEYLRPEFLPHKRVFEALGGKMRVEPSPDQLSGLGFSSTKRNSLVVKVDDRPVKIIF